MPFARPNAEPGSSVFGLQISPCSESEVALDVATHVPTDVGDVRLVVTPNIQHIAVLRHDKAFRRAYASADITTCDGFPVLLYARSRGCTVRERATGRGITTALLDAPDRLRQHRMFFVVSDIETAEAVTDWAARHGLSPQVATTVPPFGFDRDEERSEALANRIREHGTTLLFMGLGAPKSEVFVDRHRTRLPPCWALCVGQSVRIAMGLVRDPPAFVQAANIEWLWRIMLEPRRLTGRYVRSTAGFMLAVYDDLRQDARWRRQAAAGKATSLEDGLP